MSQYEKRTLEIKKRLKRFTDSSFAYQLFNYLAKPSGNLTVSLRKAPWCCMLALKWKLNYRAYDYAVDISEAELLKILNMIWNLQNEVISGNESFEEVMMSLKPLLRIQSTFQVSEKSQLESICRQLMWFSENDPIKLAFNKLTDIDLIDYYEISAMLQVWLSSKKVQEAEAINLGDIITKLHPRHSIETIIGYIKLVGIPVRLLPEFMNRFEQGASPEWEYFEDSPLMLKPILVEAEKFAFISKSVFSNGTTDLVPCLLKLHFKEEFKSIFGPVMENYVESILNDAQLTYIQESQVKELYRNNSISGKVIDFLIQEHDGYILVDSKAIEPDMVVKTSTDKGKIEKRLEGSFIKGLVQSQECAKKLKEIGYIEGNKKLSSIIVTHKNYQIPSARALNEVIDSEIEQKVIDEVGSVEVPISRVYYLSIDEFEMLLEVCKSESLSLSEIIDVVEGLDQELGKRKSFFSQYLENIASEKTGQNEKISRERDLLFDRMIQALQMSIYAWNGNVIEFLKLHSFVKGELTSVKDTDFLLSLKE
ncbi:hypothetical protein [Ferrimonas sp. YFM]|uniref:GapS1 family protein n=1 Tax=Ferrimonas sp. YFM TaxID=3028878 RepID=UPI0025743894|nr:hypothetical protein [Ferrimonas sp. YFM]BDY05970.1 hypothetical protein F0521_30110 [Ferrimonas sp. YFM]